MPDAEIIPENAEKEFPPFKPMAYFGGNMLLSGLSYILLRQYIRFILLIVLLFIPFIQIWVIIASAFDAYYVAAKMKSKQMRVPKYNLYISLLAYAIWAAALLYFIVGMFFARPTYMY